MPLMKFKTGSLGLLWAILGSCLAVCWVPPIYSQENKTKFPSDSMSPSREPTTSVVPPTGITQEQAAAILAELRAIRELLQKQTTQDRLLLIPTTHSDTGSSQDLVELRVGDHWHSLGSETAAVTLVEFTDYECQYCRFFEAEVFPRIRREFIDTGKLRYIGLDLPLTDHTGALAGAEAARCAGEQNKYWQFRSALLGDRRPISQEVLFGVARSLSLDFRLFHSCLEAHVHESEVEEDIASASLLKIDSTPTFVLGTASKGGIRGTLLTGVLPFSEFQSKINEVIKNSQSSVSH